MPRSRKRAGKPNETDQVRTAIRWFQAHGHQAFRRNVALAKFGDSFVQLEKPGRADIYGWLDNGWHFECEWKLPGNRPTPKQLEWLLATNGRGINRAFAFWCDNLDTLALIIRHVRQGARIVFDTGPKSKPGDFHLQYPEGSQG